MSSHNSKLHEAWPHEVRLVMWRVHTFDARHVGLHKRVLHHESSSGRKDTALFNQTVDNVLRYGVHVHPADVQILHSGTRLETRADTCTDSGRRRISIAPDEATSLFR